MYQKVRHTGVSLPSVFACPSQRVTKRWFTKGGWFTKSEGVGSQRVKALVVYR